MAKEFLSVVKKELLDVKNKITKLLDNKMTFDRFIAVAGQEIKSNPQLKNCDMDSIIKSVCDIATVGLPLGNLYGLSYLLPYGRTCTARLSYRGIAEVIKRENPNVKHIYWRIVKEGDTFEVQYEPETIIKKHVMTSENTGEKPDIKYAYAVVEFKDGSKDFEILDEYDLRKIRSCAVSDKFWAKWTGEMSKKAATRRLLKRFTMTNPVILKAIDLQEQENEFDGKIIDATSGKFVLTTDNDAGKLDFADEKIPDAEYSEKPSEVMRKKIEEKQVTTDAGATVEILKSSTGKKAPKPKDLLIPGDDAEEYDKTVGKGKTKENTEAEVLLFAKKADISIPAAEIITRTQKNDPGLFKEAKGIVSKKLLQKFTSDELEKLANVILDMEAE